MGINLSGAERQREMGELIPSGTIAPMVINVRGRKETRAEDGVMLDVEFTIVGGDYDKRKLWDMMMIESSLQSDGRKQAIDITMSRLRGIVESAFGIDPADDSQEAIDFRDNFLDDYEDIDGLEVLAKIGIEKSDDDKYPDKNRVVAFVTIDDEAYDESGFEPVSPADADKVKAGKAAPAKKATAKKAPAKKASASKSKGASTDKEAKKPAWAK
jgi:hypothetical protein